MTQPVVVSDAARAGPAVALETSVLTQGLPDPWNRRAAEGMDETVRRSGAEPAWAWVEAGRLRIGASGDDLERLMGGPTAKVARRDLPMALARETLGGTTVSATVWAAHAAGIEVVATGGIGGVHPEAGDVSADLLELARTPVTLVCSGPKSILDPVATMERLEELGVGLLGYRCDRLPFFVVRETPLPLEHRADDAEAVAAAVRARRALGIEAALVVCNPVPEDAGLAPADVAGAVARSRSAAASERVTGKALTPFLLSRLARETGGASLEANLALLRSNASVAAAVAVALSAGD